MLGGFLPIKVIQVDPLLEPIPSFCSDFSLPSPLPSVSTARRRLPMQQSFFVILLNGSSISFVSATHPTVSSPRAGDDRGTNLLWRRQRLFRKKTRTIIPTQSVAYEFTSIPGYSSLSLSRHPCSRHPNSRKCVYTPQTLREMNSRDQRFSPYT